MNVPAFSDALHPNNASPDDATPVLSVVIPVFNGAKYITDCLYSVATAVNGLTEQERAQIEVVLCDNHSTDNTVALAGMITLGCAFRVIHPPEHFENRAFNWHHGLASARGTWMLMLHADDALAPAGLAAILRAARHPSASRATAIGGRHQTFTTETSQASAAKPRWPFFALLPGEALRREVLAFHCPFVPFTVMRRDAYERIGGLNTGYELVQDWDLWIRLLAEGDFLFTPEVTGLWRVHGSPDKYMRVFAREHLALAASLQTIIPGLSRPQIEQSLRLQAARVTSWFPDETVSAFSPDKTDAPGEAALLSTTLRDLPRARAAATLARAGRMIALRLYHLRLKGSARLLLHPKPGTAAGPA